jgi:cadmium resistance protein CadD (predicted permease)
MTELAGPALTAAGVFAGTNIDDLVVLTVLSLSARASGAPRRWQIWVGQYTGIAVLVLVSAVAALGLTIVPDPWVRLLGLVPLGLGVLGLVRAAYPRPNGQPAPIATGLVSVAGLTIANGADNVSVYTPMFRTLGPGGSFVTVTVFAAGVAIWCAVAGWLGSHRATLDLAQRFGHWLVPAVFVVIGTVILIG